MDLQLALDYLKENPGKNKITRDSWCSYDGGTYLIYDAESDTFKTYSYNDENKGNIETEVTKGLMKLFAAEDDWIKFPTKQFLKSYIQSIYKPLVDFLNEKGFYTLSGVEFLDSKKENIKITFCKASFSNANYRSYNNNTVIWGGSCIVFEGNLEKKTGTVEKCFHIQINGQFPEGYLDVKDLKSIDKSVKELDDIFSELLSTFENIKEKSKQ